MAQEALVDRQSGAGTVGEHAAGPRRRTTEIEGGDASPILASLVTPLVDVGFECVICGQACRMAPPFNLTEFRCPSCGAQHHPFVAVEGQRVDLRALREMIVACHFDPKLAEAVLTDLYAHPHRGRSLEPYLHRGAIAAHAMISCLQGSDADVLRWCLTSALALVHPGFLGALPFAARASEREREEKRRNAYLQEALSLTHFDPTSLRPHRPHPGIEDAVKALDLEGGWRSVVFASGDDAFQTLGARRASTWSIVVDRRLPLHAGETPLGVEPDQFLGEVVQEVMGTGPAGGVVRSQHQLYVVRRNELRGEGALSATDPATQLPTILHSGPRANALVFPHRIVEILSHSTGAMAWSCLRTDEQGPLLDIQWSTYLRPRPAGGAFLEGKHIDPDAALSERAETEAVIRETGSGTEKLRQRLPRWLKGVAWGAVGLFLAWPFVERLIESFVLGGIGPDIDLGVSPGTIIGRGLFLLVFAASARATWKRKSRPFPKRFWAERNLDGKERLARRQLRVRNRVRRAWGLFDYSAPQSVFSQFGATATGNSLDHRMQEFVVHAQDRLIQDAIIAVAERHGIDMSEFKKGIQQINNYGVIASHIEGPVAAGDGAKATVKKRETAAAKAKPGGPAVTA